MNKTLYVDRIEASKLLKVSTRTIDRYMRKYRFKIRKDGRRVLIKRIDVDRIIKDHIGRLVDINDDNFNDLMNGNGAEKTDNVSSLTIKDFKVKKIKQGEPGSVEERIYKDLYQEVKNDLREKQERLEAATYRVGQLEAQTKNMVPMLDFTKKEKELQEAYVTIEQKNKQAGEAIEILQNKIRSERVAKWIYLSLVGLLLVAEPILFMLWAFA
ncbi:helix-turn-helix domain-containing protein [Candidatus Peregrinibacteria bacterium]|nr:helix-turn-helix domain-containing protein [Candidatus Peregrinibacteria bacterium]